MPTSVIVLRPHVPHRPPIEAHVFEAALDACPQAISIVDVRSPEQPLVYINRAFEQLTGYAREDVLGRNCRFLQGGVIDVVSLQHFRQAIQEGERATITLRNVRKDGSSFDNELLLRPIHDSQGDVTHFVGLQSDTAQRGREHFGRPRAWSDPTGPYAGMLVGRDALETRLQQSLARAVALGTRCALMLIELPVGTAPPAGMPQAAPWLAERFAGLTDECAAEVGSSLALLDDHQLALLLEPAPPALEVGNLARRIHTAIRRRLVAKDGEPPCPIGIAMGPGDGGSARGLLMACEHALDRARQRGAGGELAFFANVQDVRLLFVRQMERDLIEAVAQRQFTLVYQPVVQLDTARIVGFEALVRWVHPSRGPVPPAEFIPVAEATGMIGCISDWVIDNALAQLTVFDRIAVEPMRMFINISANHLEQPGFVDKLRDQLTRHHIKPGRVELEITERVVTNDAPATLEALHALRKLGLSLAVDDFGTGYSNLNGLTQLPVDSLKVDMSFTQRVTHTPAAASVSRMICELGRMLDLNVIVEGIETEGQLNHFRALSCPLGQGYLFSKPLPADEACALLSTGAPLFRTAPADQAPHLLLLDDDENILASLRRLLRREGYRIHATQSPQEAFELLANYPIGVVLSDQRMPQMNGTEFLRQVKKLHPHTVRMVLSGYSEIEAVTEAVNEGSIWRFLSKPWDDAALKAQIHLAFDEHKALLDTQRQHASALRSRARLESEVSQRDQRLALEMRALEAANDTLSMLPIPVLGIDSTLMVVMSNLEADRQFGAGAPLMGELVATFFPVDVQAALASEVPVDLTVAGQAYRLHVQALRAGDDFRGRLLSFVPRSDR